MVRKVGYGSTEMWVFSEVHGLISHKIVLLTVTVMRTSDAT